MYVCVYFASDFLETVEIMIVKFSTMTTPDMRMHHVRIIITLAFIQGHTDLNHENNKCLIISETIQAYDDDDDSNNAHQVCCED